MSNYTRSLFSTAQLGNTQGVDPLADNSTRDISAADIRAALTDLSDSAAFRKTDPYVRYVVPSNVGGTADSITISLSNDYPADYTNAIPIRFQAQSSSTGDVSINVNSIGSIGLYKENQTRVSSGDLIALSFYECVFNADADGAGTDGFTLYEGIGGTVSNPSVVSVTGTTQTVDSPNAIYVFTGSSACSVTIDTSSFTAGQGFRWINMGSATCSLTANSGTVKLSDPFVIYQGSGNEFIYTAIASNEWCGI